VSKRIALIGSSGGNLYNLGGKNPDNLIEEVVRQADAAGVTVSRVLFVAAKASMDQAGPDTPAELYVLVDGSPGVVFSGSLKEVNNKAKELDLEIARDVEKGLIDGLFLVSADPDNVQLTPVSLLPQPRSW